MTKELPLYISHKKVRAAEILAINSLKLQLENIERAKANDLQA